MVWIYSNMAERNIKTDVFLRFHEVLPRESPTVALAFSQKIAAYVKIQFSTGFNMIFFRPFSQYEAYGTR